MEDFTLMSRYVELLIRIDDCAIDVITEWVIELFDLYTERKTFAYYLSVLFPCCGV